MGPRTHAAWLCSIVFDGARAFEGVTPDLELHCARVSDSAAKLFLKPTVSTETWVGLAREPNPGFCGNGWLQEELCCRVANASAMELKVRGNAFERPRTIEHD